MMPLKLLLAVSLVVTSIAQAQSPERTSSYSGSDEIASRRRITSPSSFSAEVRGDVTSTAWGEAEFGAIQNPDRSSGAFVVSLGVYGHQSAILLTRRNRTPLGVGRYRVSERANGADEVMAMILTGSSTRPSGVFHGRSGWLVVTEASEEVLAGRFQIDGVGFRKAEPQEEGRHVNVTGAFSAAAASSSFRVCEDAE